MTSRAALVAASIAAVMALPACALSGGTTEPAVPVAAATASPAADAGLLPERVVSGDVTMRIASDVTPPTNRWYSGLAFGKPGLSVYPVPLSFSVADGGFAFGLTTPVASDAVIAAPANPAISVSIDGATGHGEVTAATPVAVTLALGPGAVTLAQGVPAIALSSADGLAATLSLPFDGAVPMATVGGTTYGIALDGGTVDGARLTLAPGGVAHLFAVPDGGSAATMAAAFGAPAVDADATGRVDGDVVTTTVTYGDAPTVVAVPKERAAGLRCDLGTYATLHGDYSVCAASSVSWDMPRIAPASGLDLAALSEDEREAIAAALAEDVAATTEPPADAYFGGKWLYRLAQLVEIADGLGATEQADSLAATLAAQLRLWTDPDGCLERDTRCFVYDPQLRGVVGLAPAFGSEQFNDHHFHHGYLVYAASVAVARDPGLAAEIGEVIDALVADIASPVDDGSYPVRRVFDPVAGHSWASGLSLFADGNNQESSSEAVMAWAAVSLWAGVRGDDALADDAAWMLAAEADAARRLHLSPDLSAFPEYRHDLVAIEWGAKRDYATWFSSEPAAMLGIQLIPAVPAAREYLQTVATERILAQVDAAGGTHATMFPALVLMYASLASEQARGAAWDAVLALPEDAIDDGLSRAYALAWIASAEP